VLGDGAGSRYPGLDHLLDAVRAPATPGELSGEQAMVAALAAEHRRAALTARPKERDRVRLPGFVRRTVVTVTASVALLAAGGTAVAAATGSLPDGVQQRAHRLFSALGIPAPRTGTNSSSSPAASAPQATPTPAPTATATATPATARGSEAPEVRATWCAAWAAAAAGGKPMNGRDRRDLIAAAGGPDGVTAYCAAPLVPPSPAAAPTTAKPGRGASHRATPPHPTPPGQNK
jgi:hypothetical protein